MRKGSILVSMVAATALLAHESTPVSTLQVTTLNGQTETVSTSETVIAIVFVSTRCPLCSQYLGRVDQLAREYSVKGVRILILNANENEPLSEVRQDAEARMLQTPIYKDRNHIAEALGADRTPVSFVLDRGGKVRYQGAFDDSPNPARIHHEYVREALDAVLAGKPVRIPEMKAIGCSIKRKTF